ARAPPPPSSSSASRAAGRRRSFSPPRNTRSPGGATSCCSFPRSPSRIRSSSACARASAAPLQFSTAGSGCASVGRVGGESGAASSRLFSNELRAALEENLATGGQTLVFLNRRGFATYLQCAACGTALTCPQCSVTLTLHRAAAALVCHHCHHHRRVPPACATCGGRLEAFGVGTEQIESALRACYPLAAVDRLDRDAAQRVGAQRRILHAWRAGDTDILVGTQMVSKGHDVPGVTL